MNTIDEIIGCIENQDAIDHDDLMVMVAEIARLREQLAAAKAEGRRDALKGVDEILAAKIEWCGGMGGDVERLQIVLEQVRDRLGCTGKATPERCKQSEGSDGDTYAGCVLDAGHDGECEMRARPERVRERERDWPEDFPHENGQYENRCLVCHRRFYGHKRRVVCKACASKPQPVDACDTAGPCKTCKGQGQILDAFSASGESFQSVIDCPDCTGKETL